MGAHDRQTRQLAEGSSRPRPLVLYGFQFVTAAEFFVFSTPFLIDLAVLVFRVTLGVCFVVHGLGKLGLVGPGNLDGFASWLQSLGFPFPSLQARGAMLTEIVGGTLLALGLFARIAAFFCLGTMLVAVLVGHKGGGYLITNNPPGREYALNLAVLMIVLMLLGPGHYSLDYFIFAAR
jgi:putative oxidoreductase